METKHEEPDEPWDVGRVAECMQRGQKAKRAAERKAARVARNIAPPDPVVQRAAERRRDILLEALNRVRPKRPPNFARSKGNKP